MTMVIGACKVRICSATCSGLASPSTHIQQSKKCSEDLTDDEAPITAPNTFSGSTAATGPWSLPRLPLASNGDRFQLHSEPLSLDDEPLSLDDEPLSLAESCSSSAACPPSPTGAKRLAGPPSSRISDETASIGARDARKRMGECLKKSNCFSSCKIARKNIRSALSALATLPKPCCVFMPPTATAAGVLEDSSALCCSSVTVPAPESSGHSSPLTLTCVGTNVADAVAPM